jgi:hypothetical protein
MWRNVCHLHVEVPRTVWGHSSSLFTELSLSGNHGPLHRSSCFVTWVSFPLRWTSNSTLDVSVISWYCFTISGNNNFSIICNSILNHIRKLLFSCSHSFPRTTFRIFFFYFLSSLLCTVTIFDQMPSLHFFHSCNNPNVTLCLVSHAVNLSFTEIPATCSINTI